MGNETSTEEGGQHESSDHAEVQGDINDLLGFLSLQQIESRAENEEENPIIKIPPDLGGKDDDVPSDEGSLPKNVEASDTDTTSRDAGLNESDDSDDTKFSEAESSPVPMSPVSVSPTSPVPVSPLPEASQDSNGEQEQIVSESIEQTELDEDDPPENDEESNNNTPDVSKFEPSDEAIIPQIDQEEGDAPEDEIFDEAIIPQIDQKESDAPEDEISDEAIIPQIDQDEGDETSDEAIIPKIDQEEGDAPEDETSGEAIIPQIDQDEGDAPEDEISDEAIIPQIDQDEGDETSDEAIIPKIDQDEGDAPEDETSDEAIIPHIDQEEGDAPEDETSDDAIIPQIDQEEGDAPENDEESDVNNNVSAVSKIETSDEVIIPQALDQNDQEEGDASENVEERDNDVPAVSKIEASEEVIIPQALDQIAHSETANEPITKEAPATAQDGNHSENDQHGDSTRASATVTASESRDKLILLKGPGQISRKDKNPRENSDVGDSSNLTNDVTKAKAIRPKPSPDKRVSRKGSQIFSEGSLKGTLEKSNENSICRDPLLKAVAAGSAVRKAKHQEKMRSARVFSSNNAWKISLSRLARTAASTAKTVASATAPVISDASQVILSSATEFAQDFKIELEKERQKQREDELRKNALATKDNNSKETEMKIDSITSNEDGEREKESDSRSSEEKNIEDERKTDSIPDGNEGNDESKTDLMIDGDSDNETEIIMNSMAEEEKNTESKIINDAVTGEDDNNKTELAMNSTIVDDDSITGFFDALEKVGQSFETENSTSQRPENSDSFDADTVSPSPKKCIYEELKGIEENFDAHIESMLGGESFTMDDDNDNDNDTDHDFSERTDVDLSERADSNDFSERSTESGFFGRFNFFVKPIITETSGEEKSPGSNKESEANIFEGITPRIKNHLDSHDTESDKLEDPGLSAPAAPQVRTRSGRVVKPVKRLIDGDNTSAWEENRYGSSDQQINIAEGGMNGESESSNTSEPNETKLEVSEEEPNIDEMEAVAVKDESEQSDIDIDKSSKTKFEIAEKETNIDDREEVEEGDPEIYGTEEVKDESKDSTGVEELLSLSEVTEEDPKIDDAEEEEEEKHESKHSTGADELSSLSEVAEEEDEQEQTKDESTHSTEANQSQLVIAEEELKTDETEGSVKDESKDSTGVDELLSLSEVAEEEEEQEQAKDESTHLFEANQLHLETAEEQLKVDDAEEDVKDESKRSTGADELLSLSEVVEGEEEAKDESTHSTEANQSQLETPEEQLKTDETEGGVNGESKDSTKAEELLSLSEVAEDEEETKDESTHSTDANQSQLETAVEALKIDETDSTKSTLSQFEATKEESKTDEKEEVALGEESKESLDVNVPQIEVAGVDRKENQKEATAAEKSMLDQQRKKSSLLDGIMTKASHLFGKDEDLLFESEDTDSFDNRKDDESGKELNNNLSTRNHEKESSILSTEDESLFKDGKIVVKYVVTKLTGYNIEVKDKIDRNDRYNSASTNERLIPKSVFEKQARDDVEVLSSSSFSSPPEIDMTSQFDEKEPQDVIEGEMNELLPIFDFIPAKSEILRTKDTPSDENEGKPKDVKEYLRQRKLFKQTSTRSIKDSLASFSTHERSSNPSVLFSPSGRRSRRRLRRQGSRMSISIANTQSTKSPYETPIENRSLEGSGKQRSLEGSGKQRIELNPIDLGGEMVGWDKDIEAKFPSVPDTEDMTEALERSELFHDTLASFSALENIDFLKKFPVRKSTNVPKSLSSLMWRQLLANWKHSEACKAMLTRRSSIQLGQSTRHAEMYDFEDSFSSSFSTIRFRLNTRDLVLPNYFLSQDSYPLLRSPDDDNGYDIIDNGVVVLTRFLRNVGPGLSSPIGGCDITNVESLLRHDFTSRNEKEETSSALSITEIQTEAKKLLPTFETIIDRIVKFSAQNASQYCDLEGDNISFAYGVKDYASIRKKAKRKYDGDVSLVKDVLRGQITFPDEGSLICGLCSLYSFAKGGCDGKEIGGSQPSVGFQIVRLKNLFRTVGVNDEPSTALPTGYRHVLINIKFDCGIIAEIQYQIAQLFEVMGGEGYSLHQELVSQTNDQIDTVSSDNVKNVTRRSDIQFDVSPNAFVQSVLRTASIQHAHIQPDFQNPTKKKDNDRVAPVTTPSKRSLSMPLSGGIGALAAQAALKKTQDKQANNNKNPAPGGIAALAAQAALKKSNEKAGTKTQPFSPGGGIAALAAQAALKKTQDKQANNNKNPAPGGIAALAAQAALKKSKEKAGTKTQPFSPGGGIAALAAQAALKKSQEKQQDGKESSLPAGGIAALAAQAALKKSQEREVDENGKSPAAGGIAALAAQAALKKSQEKQQDGKESSPLAGGIAALAAQAALKKSQGREVDENGKLPPAGGIAALAAQAALKKSQEKQQNSNDSSSPPKGGIAALAAQAALKKSQEKEVNEKPPAGGIAALAAQAALKKSQEKQQNDSESSPPAGGIAALAAQAALKRSQEKEVNEKPPAVGIAALAAQAALKKSQEKQQNASESTPPAGGIAALAAQAALKRSKEKEVNEDGKTPAAGGIAALAAQAALKKSQEKQQNASESTPPAGGIAALAAQAALKKSQERKLNGNGNPPAAGGIAALAAQAALKKSQEKQQNASESTPPAGGIAALAAQAALKKSQEKTMNGSGNPPPAGGIAALAAQAALKKSQEKTMNGSGNPPPAGGIAALAAQAALKKSQEKSHMETQASPPAGGIAALAAQAALKKSQEKTLNGSGSPPAGGIAALAAQAALRKSRNEATKTSNHQGSVGVAAVSTTDAALTKPGNVQNSLDKSDEHGGLHIVCNSMPMLLTAVLETGIVDAISNPRDVPALCCLNMLVASLRKDDFSSLASKTDEEELSASEMSIFSRRLLLRSLSISNQATSIGMIGWLEYGSTDLIDRTLNLPLQVLQQLSCNMAAQKEWAKASDVLRSLWLRCEQNLPRCHPTTICAMLDLAGALSKTEKTDSAKFIISQALDLFANYLSEVEALFFDRRYFELYCDNPDNSRVVFFDDCVDAIGIMEAFCKQFHQNLSREFLEHLGSTHPIALLNHSLVADSFLVLANCLSSSEETKDTRKRNRSDKGSRYFWSLAHSQYDIALRGWISIESLIHPNAASVTFSIARCLRELGKLKQAVKLLETLASCLEQKLDEEIDLAKKKSRSSNTTFSPLKQGRSKGPPSFISPRRLGKSTLRSASSSRDVITTDSCEREQTAAVCFWMMAVLTAELNPDELGRNRALSLLHTASLTLQRVLSKHNNGNANHRLDDHTYQACLDLYEQIEGEALDLFEPLERIPQAKDFEIKKETVDTVSPRKKRAPWEILTPMRQKREWMSPRARIQQSRASGLSEASSNNLFV